MPRLPRWTGGQPPSGVNSRCTGRGLDKPSLRCKTVIVRPAMTTRRVALGAALLALAATSACGDGGGSKQRRAQTSGAVARCAPPGEREIAAAVLDFVRSAKPTPQRFLIAAGTDSALPEGGLSALQSKGPTYLYPRDSAQQAKVRAKLESIGSYNTLMVTFRNQQRLGDSRAVVRLGGHYVGGATHGRSAAPRSIFFECRAAGWSVVSNEQEQSS